MPSIGSAPTRRCRDCHGGRNGACYYHSKKQKGRRDGIPTFEPTFREKLIHDALNLSEEERTTAGLYPLMAL